MEIIPLFKSHYSLGRSILTFAKEGSTKDSGPIAPDSIVELAQREGLKTAVVVEDSMTGCLEAYTNLTAAGINLTFGWRATLTEDMNVKTPESKETDHRAVIFAKSSQGFYDLIKIFTLANTKGNYDGRNRLDFKNLEANWTKNLDLAIPFYDSFLFLNSLTLARCVPNFSVIQPVFFLEDNNLPFDPVIREQIAKFVNGAYPVFEAKSIYYASRKNFKAYLTHRCICSQSTLDKPELKHLSSAEFCLEAWREGQKRE